MHAYVAGERVTLLRPRGAGQKQTRQSREARDQTVPEIPGAFHKSHNNCEEVTSTNVIPEQIVGASLRGRPLFRKRPTARENGAPTEGRPYNLPRS